MTAGRAEKLQEALSGGFSPTDTAPGAPGTVGSLPSLVHTTGFELLLTLNQKLSAYLLKTAEINKNKNKFWKK